MTRHIWTDAEVEILRAEYANAPTFDLAQRFGLPLNKVYAKAAKLGLTKSEDYFREQTAGRLTRGHSRGTATRFKAGAAPWNKGRAHPHRNGGQFQPGSKPHTWQPIGSYRIAGGVLQLKVADVPGPNNLRWRSVHELAWIEAHGPVPAGHVVVFKPGQRTTQLEEITVDRIELMSRADLARRNSVHRHGPELARLSQLKGAVTRQINKRMKETAE